MIRKSIFLFKLMFLSNITVILSVLIFLCGSLLLISGIYPETPEITYILFKVLPKDIILLSRLFSNIIGILLLIISYGIYKKINSAWYISILSLLSSILFLIIKGMRYKEAITLTAVLILLIFSKDYFYRKGSLFMIKVSNLWLYSFLFVSFTSIRLGISLYKDIDYNNSLWWNFEKNFNFSMFLHSSFLSILVILYFIGIKIFTPNDKSIDNKLENKNEIIKNLLDQSKSSRGNFALLPDKEYLFNDDSTGFIMHGKTKKNYISLGDPICDEEHFEAMLEAFYKLGKINDKNIAFYEIDEKHLKYYLNLGLKVIKIGEEGIVKLKNFSLEGSKNKKLRYIHNKLSKEGLRFEIINDYYKISNDLKNISDQWLKGKKASEKQFSLGNFNDKYLENFPIAVIYRDNKIIAFSNILTTKNKNEISVDLMRYLKETPNSTMDFLFIKIMLWGKENGYESFSLGMVPLSGIKGDFLSNYWNQFGSFVYNSGNNYYHFENLKRFKNKFFPTWESRYIAYNGNFNLPFLLKDITVLISGSLVKTFKK